MNDLVFVGVISTTHGIKGELRITSDFEYPEKAFRVGSFLIIDNKSYEIKSYRMHKNYHMVTLGEFSNINQVLFLKGKKVYKEREELSLYNNELLDQDLLEYDVITNTHEKGKVLEIFDSGNGNKLFRIELDQKEYLIPKESPMILDIDSTNKTITIELLEGMDKI